MQEKSRPSQFMSVLDFREHYLPKVQTDKQRKRLNAMIDSQRRSGSPGQVRVDRISIRLTNAGEPISAGWEPVLWIGLTLGSPATSPALVTDVEERL